MTRTRCPSRRRPLAALRRWLKDAWISRVWLGDWLTSFRTAFSLRKASPRPKPPSFRADWLVFEPRWGPDDFWGMASAPLVGTGLGILGTGLQAPLGALVQDHQRPPGPIHDSTAVAVASAAVPAEPVYPTASAFPSADDAGTVMRVRQSVPAPPPAALVQASASEENPFDGWLAQVAGLLSNPLPLPRGIGAGPEPVASSAETGGGVSTVPPLAAGGSAALPVAPPAGTEGLLPVAFGSPAARTSAATFAATQAAAAQPTILTHPLPAKRIRPADINVANGSGYVHFHFPENPNLPGGANVGHGSLPDDNLPGVGTPFGVQNIGCPYT
jgi:hypothetical protein